jgi:hypothetical protein
LRAPRFLARRRFRAPEAFPVRRRLAEALAFRLEPVRRRDPVAPFLPPFEPPRDDFLAVAMM